ncbi:helix-hairpin-helix domain-containing protein [Heyndrickxia sp. MSNUG]|uniref:helix-hairpin-helix domain-containing protein n=1 Tax=Heyndrickxia sp. MSNUG TaxID=3136677 RepID=UPI003C2C4855
MDWIKEHKLYIVAGMAAAIFFIYSSIDFQGELTEVDEELTVKNELTEEMKNEASVPEQKPLVMMADIKGAVIKPGVYEIEADDRVIDLIELAGGLTKDAEAASINFAMHVSDEMVIYVPRKGESKEGNVPLQSGQQTQDKQKVNLNTAAASELETLPGIGPSKAEAIIENRETNGPYKTIEDLKNISGIGDKTFEKLKELISVK